MLMYLQYIMVIILTRPECSASVSYTHLDVYKRQLGMYGNGDFFDMKGVCEEFFEKVGMRDKVDYDPNSGKTYLHPGRQDVYKRQDVDIVEVTSNGRCKDVKESSCKRTGSKSTCNKL